MKLPRSVSYGVIFFMIYISHSFAGSSDSDPIDYLKKVNDHRFYIESNLEFTLLHELAHAVIDINHVPVLGGQENAADQIAVMLMITTNHGVDDSLLEKLLVISAEWMMEWREETDTGITVFWDNHPLAIQRFFQITCLTYGADPEIVERIRKESWLPIERAWNCDKEYLKNREALAWLASEYSHMEIDESWSLTPKLDQPPNRGAVSLQILPPIMTQDNDVYQLLLSSQRLKYVVAQANQLLKLDQDINIVIDPSCSEQDAWWNAEQHSIFVCYQLVEQFAMNSTRLSELIDIMAKGPEFTMILRLPEDVRLRMMKQSETPAQINREFIQWFRQRYHEE